MFCSGEAPGTGEISAICAGMADLSCAGRHTCTSLGPFYLVNSNVQGPVIVWAREAGSGSQLPWKQTMKEATLVFLKT